MPDITNNSLEDQVLQIDPVEPAAQTEQQDFITVGFPTDGFANIYAEANELKVSPDQVVKKAVDWYMANKKLTRGQVTEIGTDALKQIVDSAYKAFKKAGEESIAESATTAITATKLNDGDIVFSTTQDIVALVDQINKVRSENGLAPLEKSLCEILYHYGQTLADYQIFGDTTGLSFSDFKAVMRNAALAERDVNQAASNIIVAKGLFGSYSIVPTPLNQNDNGK